MRKYFTSGLAILLPAVLTVMIVNLLINFVTYPFLAWIEAFVENWSFLQSPSIFFHHATLVTLISKVLILAAICGFTLFIGIIGKNFLVDLFLRLGTYFLHKLPLVNKVYKACTDVVQSIFSSSSNKFSQVVFVPFPDVRNLSIGLVTSDSIQIDNSPENDEKMVSVFVPGTPNPSVGFILMFKRSQLILSNMKVDEAMKFIISCGIVMPESQSLKPSESDEKLFSQNPILSSEGQLSQDSLDLRKSAGSF